MSDQNTDPMNGKRPFDERDSSMRATGSPLQELDIRAYDAKASWEQVFKEIVETRRELSKRLDRIEAIAHENRADLRDAEDRLDKIESKLAQ